MVEFEQAAHHPSIRIIHPLPAPHIVPLLPKVPAPVHTFATVHPSYLAGSHQAAVYISTKLDGVSNICDSRSRDPFSKVADSVVGIYPIAIVSPDVGTYEVHPYELPRSSVLESTVNILNALRVLDSAHSAPEWVSLCATPTLALTPPSPESPYVFGICEITSTASNTKSSSPANPRGAETRKGKRNHGKENKHPTVSQRLDFD